MVSKSANCNKAMKVTGVLSVVFFLSVTSANKHNVCDSVLGYYFLYFNLSFPGCYYDPDVESDATEIIVRYGFPVAAHQVTSKDGYALTLFNIPYYSSRCDKEKHPDVNGRNVLLVHSFYTSSISFLLNKNDSLAFVLSRACYNVWLANLRGTKESQLHTNYTTEDDDYWDFSLDEMALYDMPAMLSLIEEQTGQKGTICVGVGLGSSVIMAYSASKPKQSKQRVSLAVLLSQAVQLKYTKVAHVKAMGTHGAQLWSDLFERKQAKQASSYRYQQAYSRVLESYYGVPLYFEKLTEPFGPNTQIKLDRAPALLKSQFLGMSLKAFVHMCQFSVGDFAAYNYGTELNSQIYGFVDPPKYNITKINHPVFITYAPDDSFSTMDDFSFVYDSLSQNAIKYGSLEARIEGFNHFGYLYANDAQSLLYDKLIKIFDHVSASKQ